MENRMQSATQLLYPLIGSPRMDDCEEHEPESCWLCSGESSRGMPVNDWNGASFTGQNKVMNPIGRWVCEPCVSICARNTPVPGRPPKEGKTFGGNFRNYSHLYDAGDYANASKGEKPAIRAFLSASHKGPWFAAIADSGQKHVIPWAPINPAGSRRGRVMFEETEVTIPKPHEQALIDHMIDLLTAGATKESVGTGEYTPGEWQRCEAQIKHFESHWSYLRQSPWWRLALFLAQRDEAETAARMDREKAAKAEGKVKSGKTRRTGGGQAAHADGGGVAGNPAGVSDVPRSEPVEELGSTIKPSQDCQQNRNECGALGDHDARPNGNRKRAKRNGQPMLPGFGE